MLTNVKYLKGLLTLDHALKKYNSKYPLVVLYTDAFEQEGHEALDRRGIPKKRIEYLLPTLHKDYSNDARFYDCWSKLSPFSLVEYERVVQLDSDMLVLRNMDELMDVELDPVSMNGSGRRVMAASHACVCNPLKRPHYPGDWYRFFPFFLDRWRFASNCPIGSLPTVLSQHSTRTPREPSPRARRLRLDWVC